ncbi:helix-turn-helix domain-containing protein [Streptomyces sp. Inha503]|uniref:helix-turn-helix domain-containing protein n=1 Tax=Streptomyces sp. Inha503 TaxID=3383314 RepID=UPI0039A3D2B6
MRMQVLAVPPKGPARTGRNSEDSRENMLGEFLRACRSRLAPSDVGLRSEGRNRRVEGLRRQEISVLTGISVDYYSRLEQGRERTPSARTLEAIGRALRLDSESLSQLFHLAGLNVRLCPDTTDEHVDPDLLRLLKDSHQAAAFALSPCLDILAANAHARALLSPFGGEGNMIRILFTRPEARTFFAEWPLAMTASLHMLCLNAVRLPRDTEILDLVAEMSAASTDFARMWQNGAAADPDCQYGTVVHPTAGRVALAYRLLSVPTAPGQHLLLATPVPGSRSAEAFTYLAAMGGQQP